MSEELGSVFEEEVVIPCGEQLLCLKYVSYKGCFKCGVKLNYEDGVRECVLCCCSV